MPDTLYELSPQNTVKIEAWRLINILKVTQLVNDETVNLTWFISKACTMLPLAIKLVLLLCKINVRYFLHLKALMLFFLLLKRAYPEKN